HDALPIWEILILEKGKKLAKRHCPSKEQGTACLGCQPCSVVSGWGGAGAFSDGKLTLSGEVGGFLDEYLTKEELSKLIRYVDDVYLRFGAPAQIYGEDEETITRIEKKAVLADLRFIPSRLRHLGSGRTLEVLQAMEDHLTGQGVEIRTEETREEMQVEKGWATGVRTNRDLDNLA